VSPEALEPKLTAFDLKVLGAIPECGEPEWRTRKGDEAVR
jgi:hypothetical protein